MTKLIEVVGNILAVVGILVCLVAGIARMMTNWYLMGFESLTIFTVGMGLMLMACLAKLQVLSGK